MDKTLNLENIKLAMEEVGLSPANLAKKIDVSRESVSKWLTGKKFPRPDKLLKIALELDLKFDDLVVKAEGLSEPVVAFRKRGSSLTTEAHIANAKDMGRMLSALVPSLPYDLLVQPSILKNPSCSYDYIQQVAVKIRSEIGLSPEDELSFSHLIKKFKDLQAVIIPVMWGKKDKHENALHIYLPDSMTTWVYLNLDVEVHDFKFWMAHELSHVYTPGLRGNEAEDFADALAGALIFPESIAGSAYRRIARCRTVKTKISKIREYASCYSISLISVFYEINKYAAYYGFPNIEVGNGLFGANTNFNKKHFTISQTIFKADKPSAKEYVQTGDAIFYTPFFEVLKSYLIEQKKTAGYVQSILDIPLIDAKGIYAELS